LTHADIYFVVGIHEDDPERVNKPAAVGSNPLAAQLSKMGIGKTP